MMMEDKRLLSSSTTMPIPIPNEPQQQQPQEKEDRKCGGQKCPRCNSSNTKFCYYNNYSLTQPRHFCKSCKRYWTLGGSLRNVPVGGSSRKNKRLKPRRRHHSSPPPPPPPPPPPFLPNPLISSDMITSTSLVNLPSFPSSSIDDHLINYYYSSFNHDNNDQLPLLPLDYLNLLPCDHNVINNINLSTSDHALNYWNSGSDVFI